MSRMIFKRLHVFESRNTVFCDDEVLQENIIFRAVRGPGSNKTVALSVSAGAGETVRPGVKEHQFCRFDEQRPHRRGRGEKLYRSFYMR